MKRFVYVPVEMVIKGEIPQKALDLSRESTLSVRIEEPGDGIDVKEIHIASFPEIDVIDCQPTAKLGFIHSIDLTNDFVDFNKTAVLKVKHGDGTEQSVKPSLQEKHILKFRSRYDSCGTKDYCIENDGQIVYSGKIEVI